VSHQTLNPPEPQLPWPNTMPPLYGHLVARDAPPEPFGLVADVVLDGRGVYVSASTELLRVRLRLAQVAVPDLPVIAMGAQLPRGPIGAGLWQAAVERARVAMPNEVLVAIVSRPADEGETPIASEGPYTLVEPQLDEDGTGTWQPQQASGCAVRATPIADAVVEIHSHHAMGAYFSPTDNRDETARRIYGVLGRLDTPTPEFAFRVASGCRPHVVQAVPFEQVFDADRSPFRDVHFDAMAARAQSPAHHVVGLSAGRLLLQIAEDLAAIRDVIEPRWLSDNSAAERASVIR